MGQRPERVQEALRQEVSRIVHNEIKDPRLGFITITGVELTKDLRYAKVFFSVLGEEKKKKLALNRSVSMQKEGMPRKRLKTKPAWNKNALIQKKESLKR